LVSDAKQIQETKNGTIRIYQSPGYAIEEDIEYWDNNSKITLFKENTGLAGVIITYNQESGFYKFEQPIAVFVSSGKQVDIPMRYLYYDGQIYDYKTGINSTLYPIERVYQTNQGLQEDKLGAAIYISPRVMRGFLGRVYLLNDVFNNFKSFELVHEEENLIIGMINQQSTAEEKLKSFVYFDNYGGLQGPIKIWKINYKGNEKINPEYVLTRVPDYITWEF
jgi:hypothetical protein